MPAHVLRVARSSRPCFSSHVFGVVFGVILGTGWYDVHQTNVWHWETAPWRGTPRAIVESRMAPYVVGMARAVASVAPHDLKESFHKTYEQVKAVWGDAIDKGIRSLPNGGKKNERQI